MDTCQARINAQRDLKRSPSSSRTGPLLDVYAGLWCLHGKITHNSVLKLVITVPSVYIYVWYGTRRHSKLCRTHGTSSVAQKRAPPWDRPAACEWHWHTRTSFGQTYHRAQQESEKIGGCCMHPDTSCYDLPKEQHCFWATRRAWAYGGPWLWPSQRWISEAWLSITFKSAIIHCGDTLYPSKILSWGKLDSNAGFKYPNTNSMCSCTSIGDSLGHSTLKCIYVCSCSWCRERMAKNNWVACPWGLNQCFLFQIK